MTVDFDHMYFQGNLHDRYGHIVALSAKFLSLKMEFHVKVRPHALHTYRLGPCDSIAFSVLGEVLLC